MRNVPTAVVLLAALAVAQTPTDARSYFANEFRSEVFVDFARLRDLGVWDSLQGSILAPLFGEFDQQMGFGFADLREIRGCLILPEAEGVSAETLFVFLGSDAIGLPTLDGRLGLKVEEKTIGGHTLRHVYSDFADSDPGLMYWSTPGTLVIGPPALVQPIADGTHKPGVPAPELLRHTQGSGNLAYFASHLTETMRRDVPPFAESWLDPADPVTFLMVRLTASGAEDEESLCLEAMLQCERGASGPAKLEKKIAEGLETLRAHRQLGALKSYWNKVEVSHQERDVRVRLELGRPRRAAATLAALMGPLFLFGTRVEQQAAAVPLAVPAAAPEKGKDHEKGKD